MPDDFLYNGETEVLIQTFAEETSKIPLIAEGKTFYASLVWDYIYRYGLKAGDLAKFLGISEEGLLGAIGEFVEEVKSQLSMNEEECERFKVATIIPWINQDAYENPRELTQEEVEKIKELNSKVNKTSESD